MQVNAISSTSFAGKAKKTPEQKAADKKRYYEYVSKFDANRALVMSKGREEEDGKFKAVSGFAGLGALASGLAAYNKFLDARSLMQATKDAATNSINVTVENGAKFAKNMKASKVLATAAIVLATVSAAAKSINEFKAQRTANKRGFYTDRQIYNVKGKAADRAETRYNMVENTYDNTVK